MNTAFQTDSVLERLNLQKKMKTYLYPDDELDNILESSEVEEEEEFDLENAKSFFDSDDENLDGGKRMNQFLSQMNSEISQPIKILK